MHISCECKCKLDGRKCNSDNNKCRCECKKRYVREKDYIWNPATFCCQNCNYLAGIKNDSTITCDETINEEAKSNNKETKTIPTNFNEKI